MAANIAQTNYSILPPVCVVGRHQVRGRDRIGFSTVSRSLAVHSWGTHDHIVATVTIQITSRRDRKPRAVFFGRPVKLIQHLSSPIENLLGFPHPFILNNTFSIRANQCVKLRFPRGADVTEPAPVGTWRAHIAHRGLTVCTKRTKQGVSPRLGQAIEPKKNADARPTLSY